MMWCMCSDDIFIQNRSFIALCDMSYNHSISFFSTLMLQLWGSDTAVQSQHYVPPSHCHLTWLPFHHNHLTRAVVCLSSTVIASPSHCNATSTLPYNYPDGLTENVLWWLCQLYGKTTSVLGWKNSVPWLQGFSNFENPHNAQRQDCEDGSESINDDDGGTATTCEFVNFCSS